MDPKSLHDVSGSASAPPGADAFGIPPGMSPLRVAAIVLLLVVSLPYFFVQLWFAVVQSHALLEEWALPVFVTIAVLSAWAAVRLWRRPGRPARVKALALTANLPWARWMSPILICGILAAYMLAGALL